MSPGSSCKQADVLTIVFVSGYIHRKSDVVPQRRLVDKHSRLALSLACLQSCPLQFDSFARFKGTRLCCTDSSFTLSMLGFRLRRHRVGVTIEALNLKFYTFDSVPATEYSCQSSSFFVCQDLIVQDCITSPRSSCSCDQVWCVRP